MKFGLRRPIAEWLLFVTALALFCVVSPAQAPPSASTNYLPLSRDIVDPRFRAARSRHFNGNLPVEVLPDTIPISMLQIDRPAMDELPGDLAEAILIGRVVRYQAFLSEDQSAVYTDLTVEVSELIDSQKDLSRITQITLSLPGGPVQMPGGRVIFSTVDGLGEELAVNGTYLFFLVDVPALGTFESAEDLLAAARKVKASYSPTGLNSNP